MNRKVLVYEVDDGLGETHNRFILKRDSGGNTVSQIELTDAELAIELQSSKWANPWTQWVGRGIQRYTHEENQ